MRLLDSTEQQYTQCEFHTFILEKIASDFKDEQVLARVRRHASLERRRFILAHDNCSDWKDRTNCVPMIALLSYSSQINSLFFEGALRCRDRDLQASLRTSVAIEIYKQVCEQVLVEIIESFGLEQVTCSQEIYEHKRRLERVYSFIFLSLWRKKE